MKKLFLVGAGGHCRASIEIAESLACYNEIIVIDNKREKRLENQILGRNVVANLDWANDLCSESEYFVSIGNGIERAKVFGVLEKNGMTIASLCHRSAIVHTSAIIGRGVFIGAMAHIGPDCRISDGCIINTMSNLEHESKIGDFSHCAPGSIVCGRSNIGMQVMLGARATIIENVSVADKVTVGAGAVVIKNISEPGSVNVGVPSSQV